MHADFVYLYSAHRTQAGCTLIIAIDGPAASGKSTTARMAAQRLGFVHLDTGAMYRAVTLKVLRSGVRPSDDAAIKQLLETTRVELHAEGGGMRVFLDDADVTEEVRQPAVTDAVSAVSRLPAVRRAMVREQRAMARARNIVVEGRDIGTFVFPDADLKFYMVAGIEARARRRQQELRLRGVESDLETLREAIAQRDHLDSTREESPLRQAADAIAIDTSELSIAEQVEIVVSKARELMASGGNA